MVRLDTVERSNVALVASQPLTAVFFGGTGGVGHYTLRALASAEFNGGKGLRAYIVGRNAPAAEEIIAECRGIYPRGQFKFIKTEDLSLIHEVDRVCAKIIQIEENEGQDARIDYLMLSQGGSIFLPRKDSKEGMDVTMALMYYSRMRAIVKLLPLLLKSTLPARVVSVYAAGAEAKLISEDLSLREPSHYSYSQARSHMVYMHTFFMEALEEQHRGKLSLIHVFPGLVLGPGFQNPELPTWFRIVWKWIYVPLFGRLTTVPPKECGARMLFLASPRYAPRGIERPGSKADVAIATDGRPGSGVYSVYKNGESNRIAKSYENIDKDDMRRKVWDHTMKAFELIEAGGIFTE